MKLHNCGSRKKNTIIFTIFNLTTWLLAVCCIPWLTFGCSYAQSIFGKDYDFLNLKTFSTVSDLSSDASAGRYLRSSRVAAGKTPTRYNERVEEADGFILSLKLLKGQEQSYAVGYISPMEELTYTNNTSLGTDLKLTSLKRPQFSLTITRPFKNKYEDTTYSLTQSSFSFYKKRSKNEYFFSTSYLFKEDPWGFNPSNVTLSSELHYVKSKVLNTNLGWSYSPRENTSFTVLNSFQYLRNNYPAAADEVLDLHKQQINFIDHTGYLKNTASVIYHDYSQFNPLWNYTSGVIYSLRYNDWSMLKGKNRAASNNVEHSLEYFVNNQSNFYTKVATTELGYGLSWYHNRYQGNPSGEYFVLPKGREDSLKIHVGGTINLLNNDVFILKPQSTLFYSNNRAEEHNSYLSWYVDPALQLGMVVNNNLSFWGSLERVHTAPRLYQKYLQGYYYYKGNLESFIPNPSLKTQADNRYSVIALLKILNYSSLLNVTGKLSYTYYQSHNYIDFSMNNAVTSNPSRDINAIRFINIKHANIEEYKLSVAYKLKALQGELSYCRAKGYNSETQQALNNIPPEELYFNTSLDLVPWGFSHTFTVKPQLTVRATGERDYTLPERAQPAHEAGYALLDTSLEVEFARSHLQVNMGVDNLLNKPYYKAFTGVQINDRTYRISARINL